MSLPCRLPMLWSDGGWMGCVRSTLPVLPLAVGYPPRMAPWVRHSGIVAVRRQIRARVWRCRTGVVAGATAAATGAAPPCEQVAGDRRAGPRLRARPGGGRGGGIVVAWHRTGGEPLRWRHGVRPNAGRGAGDARESGPGETMRHADRVERERADDRRQGG